MKFRMIGRSDLSVSTLCLGSMGWGSRNTAEEGHAQIDRALDAGINFVDTAEMYPTYPVRAETCGRTEEIIGEWIARTCRRNDLILATKVAGRNGGFLRGGKGYDGEVLNEAVDGSLRRLRTETIDLYQLHWPNRGSYHLRRNWSYDPSGQDRSETAAHMLDVLDGARRAMEAGKIRWFGLSNETAWGAATWIRLAEENGLPRPVSIQNEYSLMCRHADLDLAELCANEEVGLLAYSPMAMGLFSGKYAPDATPPNSRRAAEATLNGRINPQVWPAIDAYREIAAERGLDACRMALAWTLTRPFVVSSIFGASEPEQLETALGAADLELTEETMAALAEAHRRHPMPF